MKDWDDLKQLAIEPSKYKEYGQLLGETLFKDSVREKFMLAVSENSQRDRLRVLLDIEDKKLTTLRWEKLCVPTDLGWEFARLDSRITFSVYVPSPVDTSRFPAISKRDLRALVLVASPKQKDWSSLKEFSVKETVESIEAAFKVKKIHCHVLANIDGYEAPTLSKLREKLQHKPSYTLLHIVCHGLVDKDEKDISLYWATADHQTERVQGENLIKNLSEFPTPYFTFLCACESASLTEGQALGGLAGRLVRELGMQAVVAMTDKVEIKTAQDIAEQFYKNLVESGQVDLALAEAKPPESDDNDIIVPALFSRLAGLPLFNDSLDKELNDEDIKRGLDRLFEVNQNSENEMPDDSDDKSKNQRSEDSNYSEKKYVSLIQKHAPILQGEFDKERKILEEIGKISPNQRNTEAKKKQNNALHNLNNLCQEVFSHQYNKNFIFNDLAFTEDLPPYDARCPFQGLLSFGLKSREFFFGREKYINNLKQKLEDNKFVAVIGGSGSGKSSLVKAGLISKLLEDSKLSKEELKQIVCFTPDKNPYSQLDEHLKKNSLPPILIVDQFEELFTVSHETERQKFINELLKLINQQNVRVVITMRVDFWEECATYDEKFREKIENSQLFILPMTSKELRDAMKRQVEEVGLIFEAGLEKLIQNEVEGEPGAMPLLQHALLELWKRRHGQWLLCDEYEKIGTDKAPGLKGAIARTADDFYDGKHNGEELLDEEKLSDEDKELVKNIFIRLTHLDENTLQDAPRRDTRQRVELEALIPNNKKPDRTKEIMRLLANKRLVITSRDKETEKIWVEVAHEALIRHWPRLQTWLQQNRENYILRQKIQKAREDWEKSNTDKGSLLRGQRLEDAIKLLNTPDFLDKVDRQYIKASIDERDRINQESINLGITSSQLLFVSNKRLDAIDTLIKTGKLLQEVQKEIADHKKFEFLVKFNQLFSEVAEFNSYQDKDFVYGVSISPDKDNQIIASASSGNNIKLWRRDGTWSQTLQGHKDAVMDVSFSHDGQILASVSKDKTIILWKAPTEPFGEWTLLKPITDAHQSWVSSISFSPKNKKIASGSYDKTIKLWDLDGNLLKEIHEHQDHVMYVAFSPDGEMIASASKDKTVKLWNLEGELLNTFPHDTVVSAVNFSPDSQTLVSSNWDHILMVWSINEQKPEILRGHKDKVRYATFSPDGETIASASEDGNIIIWKKNGSSFKLFKILKGHNHYVTKSRFSRDSTTLVSSGYDQTVKLWHINGKFDGHFDSIDKINFSPDGQTIITASQDKTAKIWRFDGSLIKTIDYHDHIIKIASNQKTIATVSKDNVARMWNINSASTQPFEIGKDVLDVSFHPDGRRVATAHQNGEVIFWSLDDKRKKTFQNYSKPVKTIIFSPCGISIASVVGDETDENKTVEWYNVDGIFQRKFDEPNVRHISFSPDGKTIITANINREIKLWKPHIEEPQPLEGKNEYQIKSIGFIFNGMLIASISVDKTIKTWNLNGKFLSNIQGNIQDKDEYIDIDSAAFSPNGDAIALADSDITTFEKRIKLWNLSLKTLLKNSYDFIDEYVKFKLQK
ncbi:MAG: CHAT domain-containing protein [Nostoc sp.]|uniref:nSTAND1 domain-containing NTPase n=1 Tax=Nostoc sp. TaxID=1180 RepID=UPI002FF9A6E4